MREPLGEAEEAPVAVCLDLVPGAAPGAGLLAVRTAARLGARFARYQRAVRSAGGRWDALRRLDLAPLDAAPALASALGAAGFAVTLAPDLVAVLQARVDAVRAAPAGDGADAGLFRHQRAGVAWLRARGNRGGLLADCMGLGKTAQVLRATPPATPLLVVGPAIAKGVWAREAARWRPDLRVSVLRGRGAFRWPAPGELCAINYEVLPAAPPAGVGAATVLVLDEVHRAKNRNATSARAAALAVAVRAAGGTVLGLSATPLENHPHELRGVLRTLGLFDEAWESWDAFVRDFRGARNRWGGHEWGVPDASAVAARLGRVMLRRRKEDVLDLPPKRLEDLPVELDAAARAACDVALATAEAAGLTPERLARALADADAAVTETGLAFELLARARAALATAKLRALLPLVEDAEEAGEPLVVWSAHLAAAALLGPRPGWGRLTGAEDAEAKTRVADAFQRGELVGVVGTIQAGGVAVTLTRATRAVFLDLAWNPAKNAQAEDRIYRIGQARPVLVTRLVAEHAIDARVHELCARKLELYRLSIDAAAAPAPGAPAEAPALPPAAAATAALLARAAVAAAPPDDRRPARDAAEAALLARLADLDDAFVRSVLAQARRQAGVLTDRQWAALGRVAARLGRGGPS